MKNKFKSLTFIETVPIGDYKKSHQKLAEIENLLGKFDSDSNNMSSDEMIRKIKILINMKKNEKNDD